MKNVSSNQSGAVLVISLIMLLLLTIIGMSGVQSTSLEEKMAGNKKDKNLAFQAAEAALRAGEARIETLWNGGNGSIQAFCTGVAGQFSTVPGCNNPPPDPKTDSTWTNANNSVTYNTGSGEVATQPRYFITYVTAYNPGAPVTPISFTVTARGTGGQDATEVILQSHFGGDSNFLP